MYLPRQCGRKGEKFKCIANGNVFSSESDYSYYGGEKRRKSIEGRSGIWGIY